MCPRVRRLVACCALGLGLGASTARAQEPAALVPPTVLERQDAVYPPDALAARQEATVLLAITVDVSGRVTEVSVVESGGPGFDAAAIAAVQGWRFQPARREGLAVPSRIRVPFRFALPPAPPPLTVREAPMPPASGAPREASPTTPSPELEAAVDVTVHGKRAPPPRATSDFVVDRETLAAAPHASAGDLLSSAPGVYISRPEGEAVAHEVFLRGFDAEHGQDIEFTVGAIPLNQPSHLHGQGYADLDIVIPETVRSLRVTEGVYDPRQGDFAVAGSADFELGVSERGTTLRTSGGSFGTVRQLLLWAPEGQAEETFGAVVLQRSDGFGVNRGSLSGAGTGQFAFELPGGVHGLAHVATTGARAGLAGVVREDDVLAGRVGFYDSYPDPTANAQSAFSSRTQAALSLERAAADGSRTSFATWLLLTDFRLRENFTGYTQRSEQNPEWVGRGDLIEQENHDLGLGARFTHRSRRYSLRPEVSGHLEFGLSFRTDTIDQAQNLLQAPQNETWDRRVDATVRATDLGAYADADLRLTRLVRLRGGVRADVLHYDIDDRLGNFTPIFDRQQHIVGFRRTALGIAAGPRATLEVTPLEHLTLLASYGQGYRSPQARQLQEGESAPFAQVRSMEVGARWQPRQSLQLTGAAYATFLSNDLAFDPQEGSLERIGPTSRKGFVVHLSAKPASWASVSASVTYVHATLDAPPPATVENPVPPFESGELLPYVPPVVARVDAHAQAPLWELAGAPVRGRLGLGASYLSARPLPYREFSAPVFLLDMTGSLGWRAVELGLDVFNLPNLRYASNEYSFVSDWGTRELPSLVPARHLAAGSPRSIQASLTLHF